MNSFLQKMRHGFEYGEQIHPVRDWLVLLVIALMVLAVSMVWNAWLFDDVASGGVLATTATSTAQVFSKTSLDTVQQLFASRSLKDASYTATATSFTDPSR